MEEEKVVEAENRKVRKSIKKQAAGKENDIYTQLFMQEDIPEEYVKVAAKEERSPVLKELFLCAIENVPMEKVEIAMLKDPPEETLRLLRQKYSKSKEIRDIADEIHSIKEMFINFQKEQKKLLKMVTALKEDRGVFDTLFPEEQIGQGAALPKEKTPLTQKEEIATESEMSKEEDNKEVKSKVKNFLEKSFSSEKTVTQYVESLYKDGYKTEQVNFILDCLEEGIRLKDLKKLFNPIFPIETMEKLKQKYIREMKTDGK